MSVEQRVRRDFSRWLDRATNGELLAARSRAADEKKTKPVLADGSLSAEIRRMIRLINQELDDRGNAAIVEKKRRARRSRLAH